MALRLALSSPSHIEQVRRFNARLRAANIDPAFLLSQSGFPQRPEDPLEKKPNASFTKRQFLALDGEDVRGGFLLQEQACEIAGKAHWCANIQMPISEGLVDRKFSHVAMQMLQLLLRVRPFVFAVGMGSTEAPFAKLLAAMKWRVSLVPFRFYVFRPARFLLEIRPLHCSRAKALIANLCAWTGLGPAAILGIQQAGTRSAASLSCSQIHKWDHQTSSLWSAYRSGCSFAAIRDESSLPFFLDLADSGLSAYQLSDRAGAIHGWIALQVTSMRDNKNFGSLHVATLLDAVCESGFERAVVRAAVACAHDQGADVLISNHQHQRWIAACAENGFWKGPSNYVLATSPHLTQQISTVDPSFGKVHLSRADGDGRLNL